MTGTKAPLKIVTSNRITKIYNHILKSNIHTQIVDTRMFVFETLPFPSAFYTTNIAVFEFS